jgi:hypothetical protein
MTTTEPLPNAEVIASTDPITKSKSVTNNPNGSGLNFIGTMTFALTLALNCKEDTIATKLDKRRFTNVTTLSKTSTNHKAPANTKQKAKKNFSDRYKKYAESQRFRDAYENKSLGESIGIDA